MSNWERNSATYSVSLLLLALTIAELTIGAFTATAQTTSVNPDEWASCTVTGPAQPNPEVVATAVTDQDGAAHFFAIRPGRYQAHIDEALLSPSPEIEVLANEAQANEVQANDGSAEEVREQVREQVRIEWPWSPAVTRRVRGWITSWQKDSSQNRSERRPFARVMVQLLDLRSGKLLASTHTNIDGYYEFSVSRDGLYVVRVSEAQDPSRTAYDKAVEVAWQASRDSMPRLEVEHLCGGGLVELPDIDQQNAAATVANGSIPTK
jgi:hypothetical protein